MDEYIKSVIERVHILLSKDDLQKDSRIDAEKLYEIITESEDKVSEFVNYVIYDCIKHKMSKNNIIKFIDNIYNMLVDMNEEACAEYLKPLLLKKLEADIGKSLFRLKFERFQCIIYLLFFILIIVGYKFYNSYDTSSPILSVNGINNVISIGKKINRHDAIVNNKVRVKKGSGLGKLILSWPFSLSDEERKYYGEYIGILQHLVKTLSENRSICNADAWDTLNDDDKIFKDIKYINEYVENKIEENSDISSEKDIISVLIQAIKMNFSCQ